MTTRFFRQALSSTLFLGMTCSVAAQTSLPSDPSTTLSAADTVFIQTAGAAGLAEVQLGKMALDQSSDAAIKALAQHMIDDHDKANDALKSLAVSKKVSFPSDITKDAQKEVDKLKAEKGSNFDQAWSKAIVQDHQDAIKLFDNEGKQTKDPDLQKFVKSTEPALKSHLAAAQKIAAVPDARDKAMGQSAQSMTSAMDDVPAASTAATPASTTTTGSNGTTTTTSSKASAAVTPTAASPTIKTPTATSTSTAPAAATGAKH